MPNESGVGPLPDGPDLRHLKGEAKEMVRSGAVSFHAEARVRCIPYIAGTFLTETVLSQCCDRRVTLSRVNAF